MICRVYLRVLVVCFSDVTHGILQFNSWAEIGLQGMVNELTCGMDPKYGWCTWLFPNACSPVPELSITYALHRGWTEVRLGLTPINNYSQSSRENATSIQWHIPRSPLLGSTPAPGIAKPLKRIMSASPDYVNKLYNLTIAEIHEVLIFQYYLLGISGSKRGAVRFLLELQNVGIISFLKYVKISLLKYVNILI